MPRRMRGDLAGSAQHRLELVAEHLDRDVAAHAGQQLVKPHLDGLSELVGVAGQLLDRILDLLDQRFLGKAGSGHSPAASE